MIKVLSFFSLSDDEYLKKAEKLYVFPFMSTAGFYSAYTGAPYYPYFIMIECPDD